MDERLTRRNTEPFHKSDIGKRVFLTRTEAEAALKGGVA